MAFTLFFLLVACAQRPEPSTGGNATSGACPDAVAQSVAKQFPGGTLVSCKPEGSQFEAKVDRGEEHLEADVSSDGRIVQTEAPIALDQVPEKVMAAFAAKYPGTKPTKAEKQVRTGAGTYYELAFPAEPKAKEATFAEDGSFVEEE